MASFFKFLGNRLKQSFKESHDPNLIRRMEDEEADRSRLDDERRRDADRLDDERRREREYYDSHYDHHSW